MFIKLCIKKHLNTLKHSYSEYDIFKGAPSLPTFNDLKQVARNRGISWRVIKGCKKIELAQLLNIPLIMNPNF